MNFSLILLLALAQSADEPAQVTPPATPSLNDQAIELLEAGDYDQAVTMLERAVAESDKNPVIVKNLAVARNNRGNNHLNEMRESQAITDFEKAVELDPENSTFHTNLGYAYLKAMDFSHAEMILLNARRLFPDEPLVYQYLGFLYYRRDELKRAVETWEKRLELAEDSWTTERLKKAKRELAVSGHFVDRTSNDFTLKFLGSHANYQVANAVLSELESARSAVCSELGHFPDIRTTVLLYDKANFRKATGSHGWVGGLYDGKIHLPVGDFEKQRERVARTCRHEYTHRVIADMAPGCPIWINEGLAECMEDSQGDHHAAVKRLTKEGLNVPSFASMPKVWASQTNPSLVSLQYAASESFMAFLRDHYGIGAVRNLLRDLGGGEPLDLAMRRSFGGDLKAMEALWRREILP